MLNPSAIIEQVRHGTAPTAWKVLRPASNNVRNSTLIGGFLGCMIAPFLCACAGLVSVLLGSAGAIKVAESFNNGSTPDPSTIVSSAFALGIPVIIVPVLIAIATIGLGVFIGRRRATSTEKDSFLVITPEGVVRSLSATQVEAIDFAALDDMTILIQAANNGASASLELHYKDGAKRTWWPGIRFGSDQSVAQRIARAFEEYTSTIAARSRGIQ